MVIYFCAERKIVVAALEESISRKTNMYAAIFSLTCTATLPSRPILVKNGIEAIPLCGPVRMRP